MNGLKISSQSISPWVALLVSIDVIFKIKLELMMVMIIVFECIIFRRMLP